MSKVARKYLPFLFLLLAAFRPNFFCWEQQRRNASEIRYQRNEDDLWEFSGLDTYTRTYLSSPSALNQRWMEYVYDRRAYRGELFFSIPRVCSRKGFDGDGDKMRPPSAGYINFRW